MSASKFPNEQNAKLIDENGLPIDATNPLDTTLKGTDNKVKLVDNTGVDISSTNGLNVVLNNSVKFDYTQNKVKITDEAGNAFSSTNGLPVTGTFWQTTQPVSGTVTANINASQNTVKIATTDNTVKIDQSTAGANHFELRDATNSAHVAKVDSNGSVNTKITNDNASAVPTSLVTSGNTVKIDQTTANANHVELVNSSGNLIGQSSASPLYVAPNTTPVVNLAGDILDVEIKNGSNVAAVDASGSLQVKISNSTFNLVDPITPVNAAFIDSNGNQYVRFSQTGTNNNVKITDGTDVAQIDTNGRIGTRIYGTNAGDVVDVSGTSLNTHITNQPAILNQVRGTGNTWVSQRVADQFQYNEFNTLANNGSFTVYGAVFGTTWKITVRRITISATIAGLYTFNWVSSTGAEVLMYKVRMIAGETQWFDFDGWVSPYNGGSIKLYNNTNNTGSTSAVTCVVEAWEQ